MAIMRRSNFEKGLEKNLNTFFGMAYREKPQEWTMVFDTENSQKAWEEDVLEVGLGAAQRRQEGDTVAYDAGGDGWTSRYVHREYALAFAITQVAIEDDQYRRLGPKYARSLARSMRHSKEIYGASILNNSTSGTYAGGDGVALLSASHPLWGGGTASNTLSTPADLSETSVETLLIQISTAVDDRGLPIDLMPSRLILPPQLPFEAQRLLKSVQRVDTGDNDINAIRSMGVFDMEPAVVRRMTDPDMWFIKTDCPEGLKHFSRVPLQRGMQGDFETDNMRYKARERYSFGWSDWRSIFGTQGAG